MVSSISGETLTPRRAATNAVERGTRMRASFFAISAAVAALTLSPIASAGDVTLAETLFREGKDLMKAGDLKHACPKLAESYRQDPASGTLLALAYCQEQLGQTATAWGTYNAAVLRARQEGRADRETAARERASSLEPKLAKLSIQVAPETGALSGLTVTRDGETIPQAAWGSAMPVDPGEHVIDVVADGKKPWQARIKLGDAEKQLVNVPALEDGPAAAAAKPAAAASAASSSESPKSDEAKSGGSALPVVGLVTAGVGVVALGVGVGFGLHAKSLDKDSKADGHCDSTGCDDVGRPLNEDALAAANLSTVLFIAGGALVAGGLTLYFVGGSSKETSASLGVTPVVAKGGGSVLFHGAF